MYKSFVRILQITSSNLNSQVLSVLRFTWLMAYMVKYRYHSPCSYVTKQVSMLQRMIKSHGVHKEGEKQTLEIAYC